MVNLVDFSVASSQCSMQLYGWHVTSGTKSDVTIVFLDTDFLKDAKPLAIRP